MGGAPHMQHAIRRCIDVKPMTFCGIQSQQAFSLFMASRLQVSLLTQHLTKITSSYGPWISLCRDLQDLPVAVGYLCPSLANKICSTIWKQVASDPKHCHALCIGLDMAERTKRCKKYNFTGTVLSHWVLNASEC